MKCHLYTTQDSENTIDKTLENDAGTDIVFLTSQDLSRLVVKIKKDNFDNDYNYMSLEVDGKTRYYFIESFTVMSNDILTLELTVDVLMTYQNEIKELRALLVESDTTLNGDDITYKSEKTRETVEYKLNNPFTGTTDIMVTAYGGIL